MQNMVIGTIAGAASGAEAAPAAPLHMAPAGGDAARWAHDRGRGIRRRKPADRGGEYQDTRCIQIGPLPEPPRELADGTADHASWRAYRGHMPVSEVVERGSPEYGPARDGGLLLPLPPLPVATPRAIAEAEEVIGYPLPRLLRRLYLEAGNGGFGARRGILGVSGGVPSGDWDDLVQLQRAHRADPDPFYPPWLISVFDWGCAIWSLIDCRHPAGPMWSWDGNDHALRRHDQAITGWLALWPKCRLTMPEGTEPTSAEEARRLRAGWQAAHPGQSQFRRVTKPGTAHTT